MKIFIFGSNGMLGNYVRSYLLKNVNNVISFTRNDYDLNNLCIDSLTEFLKNKISKNDVIINCAGVIPQASKQRDLNTRQYFLINSLFPVILSMICNKFDVKMIHITTDCVFSGKDGKYNENSLHDESNDYGLSKSLGELCQATIIRTSIIGEELYNKRSLLEWVKSNENKEINGYTNHIWNGVTCLQLSKIIENIIYKKLFWSGIRHIFSESVSKYELVLMINEIYELNISVQKLETKDIIDKTITSIYDEIFEIPSLYIQIREMKNFEI